MAGLAVLTCGGVDVGLVAANRNLVLSQHDVTLNEVCDGGMGGQGDSAYANTIGCDESCGLHPMLGCD